MAFAPSETENLFRQVASEFAVREVRSLADYLDRTGEFPRELIERAGELGFLGAPYPAIYGGSEAGYLALGLVVEELARASFAVAAIVSVHHLAAEAIFRYGTEAQRDRLLPSLARGEGLGCFAFTEPSTGSDPREIKTRAEPVQGGYRLYGEKAFVSLGSVASIAVVFAVDETGRVGAFVVDPGASGFEVKEALDTLGGRGLVTSPVVLDGAFVSAEDRLGGAGQGYEVLLETISMGKLCVAFQALGIAGSALDLSVTYVKNRRAYGRPIGELPTIQWHLAEMAARVEASRWLAYESMSRLDRGESVRKEGALAKLFCSRSAVEVTDMAMQVHGAYGYVRNSQVERLYRDAKLTELYEGVSEIQRAIVARHLLGQGI